MAIEISAGGSVAAGRCCGMRLERALIADIGYVAKSNVCGAGCGSGATEYIRRKSADLAAEYFFAFES